MSGATRARSDAVLSKSMHADRADIGRCMELPTWTSRKARGTEGGDMRDERREMIAPDVNKKGKE